MAARHDLGKISRRDERNLKTPGMANIFWMPIQTRTEMLTTGFRSMLGIKVFGPDLVRHRESRRSNRESAWRFSRHAQCLCRAHHGRLLPRLRVNREAAARYGLTVGDVNDVSKRLSAARPSRPRSKARERYPISARYAPDFRQDLDSLKRVLDSQRPTGAQIPISLLADIRYRDWPAEHSR